MYNGIGLTTPRGSGTNGYVVRNLSALRTHKPAEERQNAWDVAPPKHREPDQAILEHEKKRKVEIKCLELQLELEDKGVDEDLIEEQVAALRKKLLENLAALNPSGKGLKPSDTHAIAAAKKVEMERMARALGTRPDYEEGDAFNRDKQEENKLKRRVEREEREKRADEEKQRMTEQRTKWEAEKRERERLRRRQEDEERHRSRADDRRERMPPPRGPRDRGFRRRSRSASPRRDSRTSRSPGPRRRSASPRRRSTSPRHRRPLPSPPRSSRSPPPARKQRGRSPGSDSEMSVSSKSSSRS